MALLGADELNKKLKLTVSIEEVAGLIYHSIFDYPLKFTELGKWTVGQRALDDFKITRGIKIKRTLEKLSVKNGYLSLTGEISTIKRQLKQKTSLKKIAYAKDAAGVLSLVPSIKFVGITGSLAMLNADSEADIDLIVICKKDTLWTSRLLGLILLRFAGVKVRSKNNPDTQDRICTNIWLSEDSLSFRERNIYTAHEIVQIVPLVDKNNCFEKLLSKNKWVGEYWPSAIQNQKSKVTNTQSLSRGQQNDYSNKGRLATGLLRLLNNPAWHMQKFYMRNSVTNEKICYSRAMFHPVGLSSHIVRAFKNQLVQLSGES